MAGITRHWAALLMLTSLGMSVGCTLPPNPGSQTITLAADASAYPFAESLGAAYESGEQAQIDLVSMGYSQALAALEAGQADAAVLLRTEASTTLLSTPVGRVSFLLIAGPDAGLTTLTPSQAGQILSGQVANWAEAGGADLPVQVISLPPDDAGMQTIQVEFLNGLALSSGAQILPDSDAALAQVAKVPGGVTALPDHPHTRTLMAELNLIEVTPDDSSPLSAPLVIITRLEPSAGGARLLRWASSEAGRAALAAFNARPDGSAP